MPLEQPRWDQPLFAKVCDGLASVLLALKKSPVIAFQRNSQTAEKIALEIEVRCRSARTQEVLDFQGKRQMAGGRKTVLDI